MTPTDRLRPHPDQRLAAPVQFIDCTSVATSLRNEPHASVAGHRQTAVVRHGPVTMLVMAFEAGGQMKEHKADGVVTIHVLSGQLQVSVDAATHVLGVGQLLTLAPGVLHSLSANTPVDMLLTVHRIPTESAT